MSYVVLARKYRPQIFEEIIGQEHVSRTLKNAIKLDKLSHAYLFTGPRGVGKTTTARILAKAVNCLDHNSLDPCNKCSNCVEITRSESVDIIEIDAASNRGIDEIRKLRENIKFAPANSKYKIYIIDEVHMLTKEAFNAILKTLEEPPPHVIFIMATTEPEKVLDTITSRCQTFHFKLITEKMIKDNLEYIASKENIKHDDESLWLIARAGNGSIRDSQSIMDQVISYSEGDLKASVVSEILGLISRDILFMYTDYIVEKDVRSALELNDRLAREGINFITLLNDLINHFRNLMFAKVFGESTGFLGISGEYSVKLAKYAENFSKEQLVWITEFLMNNTSRLKYTENVHIVLDTVLFKLCQDYVSYDDIIKLVDSGQLKEDSSPLKKAERKEPPAKKKPPLLEKEDFDNAEPAAAPEESDGSAPVKKKRGGRWESVLELVKQESAPLYFALQYARATLKGKTVNVHYKGSLDLTERQKNILNSKIAEIMGEDYRVSILKEQIEPLEEASADKKERKKKAKINPVKLEEEEPVVGRIVEIFKGQIEKE